MAQNLTVIDSKTPNSVQTGGLVAGTEVLTLAGATPVEFLSPGDRIITRTGAQTLRAIRSEDKPSARMIRISASALGVEQPEDDMIVASDQDILIRDWRAKALKGVDQAVVPASKLIDGEYIRRVTVKDARVFTLEFDGAVVIYACGVELACSAAKVEA